VLLNGKALDPKTVPYAGLTPGFAGMNQIHSACRAIALQIRRFRSSWVNS
jgi:hypothetical protein